MDRRNDTAGNPSSFFHSAFRIRHSASGIRFGGLRSALTAFRTHLTGTAKSDTVTRMNWRDRIVTDPLILKGKPCIKGTRIPAALILGYLAAGRDSAAILREFPDLKAEDVTACLDFARDLASFEAAAA